MGNKVKFGLKNVHYAKITEDTNGNISYGTVKSWPGAVNISLDAEGDTEPFYADNVQYYVSATNNGYSGEFESALVPNDFRIDIMGDIVDSNDVIVENAEKQPASFALMFQFEGDKNAVRHILYNCKATRASTEGSTTEDTITPQTETMSFTASPRKDGVVKAMCDTPTSSAYLGWFNQVYEPVIS